MSLVSERRGDPAPGGRRAAGHSRLTARRGAAASMTVATYKIEDGAWDAFVANENGTPLPKLSPHPPSLRLALWKRLPGAVTQLVGPAVVSNIP